MLVCLVGVIVAFGTLASLYAKHQLDNAKDALQKGSEQRERGLYVEATSDLKRSLAIAEDIPFSRHLISETQKQLRLVERAQAAKALHTLADQLRFQYGTKQVSGTGPLLEAQCRPFWEKRHLIVRAVASEADTRQAEQVRNDLTDLAILWTDLHVRLASPADLDAARRQVLDRLAEVEQLFGPSRVLCLERQHTATGLGLAEMASSAQHQALDLEPKTAWEHYAVGRFLLRSGNLTAADNEFDKALRLQPENFWPHLYKGTCAYQRGERQGYQDAVAAFSACIALGPEAAWCYYNRALAYARLDRADRALPDYDQALVLDPNLAEAALNRAVLHYHAKHYANARRDLDYALEQGAEPAAVHFNMALVEIAQDNRAGAIESLQRALAHNPQHPEAKDLWTRLKSKH
jgi:tetratricopeptide (TPR) repeat protein